MITTERIIEEMEHYLNNAKSAKDDQAIREALTAVSALCQVVLGGKKERQEEPIITPRTMAISHKPLISSLEGKPLDEEDANGGSIFDF
ncbi:YwdI family protein [Sporosarcina highlanderae]|uniref:YwdI family protein n=1 Tax=Sporosarcina highlanderae TaxID=3035916 RepID=A0ABT8JPE4_9BACL|nr:YwdI family protein [Sporosarcina highlanderae]MDN4606059.1 YwdI family protein [Sporosarcina highlanderae]